MTTSTPRSKATLRTLWTQFLPLSLSDVTMAAGDPLMTTTLAHLPDARSNLAAVGIAKSLAVFFESPIIMVLHASNALGGSRTSSLALWRFVLLAIGVLSGLLLFLTLPPVFSTFGDQLFGAEPALADRVRHVLLLVFLWPAAIGWRRYYQGLLIRAGQQREVGRAGIGRLLLVASVLGLGLANHLPGTTVAGLALAGGVVAEAFMVTLAARRLDMKSQMEPEPGISLPKSLPEVWRYYWPLANSMLVVWGGRALLVALVARAADGPVALAAWPAAWGFVLLIANATRMVQQVIIRNRGLVSDAALLSFALSVGGACSLLLLAIGSTPAGLVGLSAFVGNDAALLSAMRPAVWICVPVPLVVALQNAVQGLMIGEGRTGRINAATWLGTGTLLLAAALAIRVSLPGAAAAAGAMVLALGVETAWLAGGLGKSVSHRTSGVATS